MRAKRAGHRKQKSVSEEILNFLDVGYYSSINETLQCKIRYFLTKILQLSRVHFSCATLKSCEFLYSHDLSDAQLTWNKVIGGNGKVRVNQGTWYIQAR